MVIQFRWACLRDQAPQVYTVAHLSVMEALFNSTRLEIL